MLLRKLRIPRRFLLCHIAVKMSFTETLSLNLIHGIRGKHGGTRGNKPVFGKLPIVNFSIFLAPSINSDLWGPGCRRTVGDWVYSSLVQNLVQINRKLFLKLLRSFISVTPQLREKLVRPVYKEKLLCCLDLDQICSSQFLQYFWPFICPIW